MLFVTRQLPPPVLKAVQILSGDKKSAILITMINNNTPDLTYLILAPFMLAYLVILLRTILTAYRAMARLRTSPQSWDALVLTGVDAQGIILKHWRSVIGLSLRPFLLVAATRAVILCFIGADYWQRTYMGGFTEPSALSEVLSIALIIFALSVVQLPFAAACGILGSLSENKLPGKSIRGVTVWILIALLMGLFFWTMSAVYSTHTYSLYQLGISERFFSEEHRELMNVLVWSGASFFDSGMFTGLPLVSALIYSGGSNFIVVLIVATGYGLLTWALLRLSVWFAVRQGMLTQREGV